MISMLRSENGKLMGDRGEIGFDSSGRMTLETAAHLSKAKQAVTIIRFVTQKKVNSSIGS